MKMIGHKRPSKAGRLEFFNVYANPAAQLALVPVVQEDLPFFDPSRIHMMKCSGKIYARIPWHDKMPSNTRATIVGIDAERGSGKQIK